MALDVAAIYHGSDGDATKALYAELEKLGARGQIALNLFRSCKASERAKAYRRRYKSLAYDKKNWSLKLLCDALAVAEDLPVQWRNLPSASIDYWRNWTAGNRRMRELFLTEPPPLAWGWKEDPAQEFHKWVLYVELPTGQVSFHAQAPLTNHRFHGEWDRQHMTARRVIAYAHHVLTGDPPVRHMDIGTGNISDRQVAEISEHLRQVDLFYPG